MKIHVLSVCQKSLAEFAPAGAKTLKSVFSGDMCVGENTSHPANVRTVRVLRTVSALQRGAIPLSKKVSPFLTVSTHRKRYDACGELT